MHRTRNAAYPRGYPGFESLPLRHQATESGSFFLNPQRVSRNRPGLCRFWLCKTLSAARKDACPSVTIWRDRRFGSGAVSSPIQPICPKGQRRCRVLTLLDEHIETLALALALALAADGQPYDHVPAPDPDHHLVEAPDAGGLRPSQADPIGRKAMAFERDRAHPIHRPERLHSANRRRVATRQATPTGWQQAAIF